MRTDLKNVFSSSLPVLHAIIDFQNRCITFHVFNNSTFLGLIEKLNENVTTPSVMELIADLLCSFFIFFVAYI